MAKSTGKREWMNEVESRTLKEEPDNRKDAVREYNSLSYEEQLQLAEEVVATRSAELCRAHRNVIAVYFGSGRKHDREGIERVDNRPSVIFMVKRKWGRRHNGNPDEQLPKHIFTYHGSMKKRRLVAIPTDVEDSSAYYDIDAQAQSDRPQSEQLLVNRTAPELPATGVITCAIRRKKKDQPVSKKLFLMSCRHVFSLTKLVPNDKNVRNRRVGVQFRGGPAKPIGKTLDVRGPLRNGTSENLDSQLAEVASGSVKDVKKALKRIKFAGRRSYATKFSHFPKTFFILTARRTIRARGPRFANNAIKYRPNLRAEHRVLVESKVESRTKGGDSGSPVVTRRSGGQLLGMHVAGKGNRAFMIPAWHLFSPQFYSSRVKDETWFLAQVDSDLAR